MIISERSREQLRALASLSDKKVDRFWPLVILKPVLLPPSRLFSGRTYFDIYFKDQSGKISLQPVIDRAIFSVGGKGVLPWIEIGFYRPEVVFEGEGASSEVDDITHTDTEWRLFKILGDLIPPGGHMMVPYELDDNTLSRMTFAALQRNIPMVATPIGFLLFRIGFSMPFRDWYISEGGHEGPRKLQFEKPLGNQNPRPIYEKILKELEIFIQRAADPKHDDVMRCCLGNAHRIRKMIIEKALPSQQTNFRSPNTRVGP